jgi:hypothetical protein
MTKTKSGRMHFTLPKPEPKADTPVTDETVIEGPFEATTAAGRRVVWGIFKSPVYGDLYRVNPENKGPLAMGRSKADIWRAVFADAERRNV